MSFIDCITGKVRDGKIPPKREEDLRAKYEDMYQTFRETMGDDEAAGAAAERFVKRERARLLKESENTMQAARYQQKVDTELKGRAAKIAGEKEQARPFFGIIGNRFLFGNPQARAAREFFEAVHTRAKTLEWQAHALIRDLTDRYRSTHAGFKQDVAGFKDVVREIGGVNTGNAEAKMHAESLRRTFKTLREMHDRAGGIIGDIEAREGTAYRFDYFPQTHDAQKVAGVDFAEWRAFLEGTGGFTVYDPKSGLRAEGPNREAQLKAIYNSIRSGGLNDIAAQAQKMRATAQAEAGGQQSLRFQQARQLTETLGDVGSRRDKSRLIHFEGIDGFLKYNQRYGSGDDGLFSTAMSYITRMSRDIAVMQRMGPKPAAIYRMMESDLLAAGVAHASTNNLKGMYKTLTGLNDYAGELPWWYRANAARIELARSAYLGSAAVSALSDQFFIGYAARMHGLKATGALGNYYKAFAPGASATRRVMGRHLFISNAVQGMSLQGARMSETATRGGMLSFMSGLTNRAGGLGFMTDMGKAAPALELAGQLAEYKSLKTGFGEIDPALRHMAESHGITAYDWDKAMKAEPALDADTGADFIFPHNISELGGAADDVETAMKFGDLFTRIGDLATNEPNLQTRTITTGAFGGGDARPGSIGRAIAQNVFFAKSFPVTVVMNYTLPALRAAAQGRRGGLASIVVMGSVFGAMALQARNVIAGKDPEDMTTAAFWGRTLLQSGGLGIFGDFLLADYNRYGGGPFATALGPTAGTVSALMSAIGPSQFFGDSDPTENDHKFRTTMAKVWKVTSKEIPVVRLWYARLLVERGIFDQVEKAIDPNYNKRIRNIERSMEKKQNQGFWWRPGTTAPQRAPQLERAAGQ